MGLLKVTEDFGSDPHPDPLRSQRYLYRSKDPDPYQNVTDLEHRLAAQSDRLLYGCLQVVDDKGPGAVLPSHGVCWRTLFYCYPIRYTFHPCLGSWMDSSDEVPKIINLCKTKRSAFSHVSVLISAQRII